MNGPPAAPPDPRRPQLCRACGIRWALPDSGAGHCARCQEAATTRAAGGPGRDPLADALDICAGVARQTNPDAWPAPPVPVATLCACSRCEVFVRAPDGLCMGCRVAGCQPLLGIVRCLCEETKEEFHV